MKSFVQTIILLIIANISFAQTNYFVDITLGTDAPGNGTGSGSSGWKTIEYAIDNVSNPTSDSIIINISSGVYNLSNNQIDINRNFLNLSLVGAGSGNTFIQPAPDTSLSTSRVIKIDAGNTVSLKQLTIRYGRFISVLTPQDGGGGILNNGGTLNIDYCKITENTGYQSEYGQGGGIANQGGNLTIKNSTISNNIGGKGYFDGTSRVGAQGGGICSMDGTLIISNSTINNNYAPLTGGGVCVISNTSNAFFNLENSTVYGNTAKEYGE
jgi:hypothetical protein